MTRPATAQEKRESRQLLLALKVECDKALAMLDTLVYDEEIPHAPNADFLVGGFLVRNLIPSRRIAADSAKAKPLTARELFDIVSTPGSKIPMDRALATFAARENWVQIYMGTPCRYRQPSGISTTYTPRACEWAFIGPVRPPYELAQNALTAT